MEVVHRRCCGLDVHKKSVVACVVLSDPSGPPQREVRTFGTFTHEVLALADWLAEQQITHVALESTGVYWKPIWNLLEDRFALLLVNPRHIKAVPGRKTDVHDAEWLAELLRHGLLTASFVPDRTQRELRELTRYQTLCRYRHNIRYAENLVMPRRCSDERRSPQQCRHNPGSQRSCSRKARRVSGGR